MFLKKAIVFYLIIGLFSCGSSKYHSASKQSQSSSSKAYYNDNSGLTMEEAVVIYANNTMEGISLEYQFVGEKEGQRGVDWNLVQQSLQHDNDKDYDVLVIKLNKTTKKKLIILI